MHYSEKEAHVLLTQFIKGQVFEKYYDSVTWSVTLEEKKTGDQSSGDLGRSFQTF